ncbi:MAG: fibronectin type III domain-containing protein [Candidatus Saccharibacteria bacterium]
MKKKVLAVLVLVLMMVSVMGVYTWNAMGEPANLVPIMTSNTSPSGECNAITNESGVEAYKAFDRNPSTWWNGCNGTPPGWLSYTFPQPKVITKYSIQNYPGYQSTAGRYDPMNWTFEAYNGSSWVTLDSQTNQHFSAGERKEYSFTNTTAFSAYRIYVSACGSSNSPQVVIAEMELMGTDAPVTPAPTNLSATAGNAQISLSWDAVTGATSYKVKRSTTQGGPYAEIASNVTATNYLDTGLTNGTTYYYVVTAVNSGGESANSNEASATPQDNTPPPATGNNLLRIRMTDGQELEFQMSGTEVQSFVTWYNGHTQPSYMIAKTYNAGPFTSRKVYIAWEKVVDFEVMNY